MKKSEADIIRAAEIWWASRKPMGWQTSDHVGQPTILRVGNREDEALAVAVGEYVKLRLQREKRRATAK